MSHRRSEYPDVQADRKATNMSITTPHWITRSDLQHGDEAVLADWSRRLMQGLQEEAGSEELIKQLLPELSAEFSAQCCQWWERSPRLDADCAEWPAERRLARSSVAG